ncbi:DNA/RNA-binding domain E.t1.c1-type [Penicillium rubens]|uniref:DNA/RNA-binding domain E.t1.c1-type n=1 Tax=Penicillium rubens TaxID=1108849 RepID=UPI002A5A8BE7|nr:DNA/RNA-binding domain E.t1.c1-type [Penicillium rubens]KAJ5821845.1 DNA/RNA-binding domain E.t1.c1-type [Penicillium rubens]
MCFLLLYKTRLARSKYRVIETDFTLKLRNPTAEDRLSRSLILASIPEPLVPWSLLITYLNSLFDPNTIISKIEDESFPLLNNSTI